jgi:hypothetical protein
MSFRTTLGVWLSRWLLFRFMFMSGVVKLASGDPNWWNLSALSELAPVIWTDFRER